MTDAKEPSLLLKNISKSFSGVQVLNSVDFSLYSGEVHVLVGENGAGKSTLMKILAGAYQHDSGDIIIDGVPHLRWNPAIARSKGVGMGLPGIQSSSVPQRRGKRVSRQGRTKIQPAVEQEEDA